MLRMSTETRLAQNMLAAPMRILSNPYTGVIALLFANLYQLHNTSPFIWRGHCSLRLYLMFGRIERQEAFHE